MAKGQGQMFITGPDVIRTVTHEEVTAEALGGADAHATLSGVSHFTAGNEREALALTRRILGYLPLNNLEEPPIAEPVPPPETAAMELAAQVPENPNAPYDVHGVIDRIVDPSSFLEVQPEWAMNVVTGLARMAGHPIGVVANQPSVLAGCLDIAASTKAARFVRFCDAFNVPLVTLVDVPGFLPGTAQEYGGIIRHGAKLLYAYAEATVPKLTVILRKAYGGAYDVMCSKHLGGDLNFAWPTAEIAVMGTDGAVNILFRREIDKAPAGADREKLRAKLAADYSEQFLNPYLAAERGYIDDVIDPAETRPKLLSGFSLIASKREDRPPKKHGNEPL